MHFNSKEILKSFGESCGIAKPTDGVWCKVQFHCTDCDLWSSCQIGRRNDFDETEQDTERNPCFGDIVLRMLYLGQELHKYALKPPFEKSWHDEQPIAIVTQKQTSAGENTK